MDHYINIAEYLVSHPEKVTYQQEDRLSGLRKQWGFTKILIKQCTQFLNEFNILLYTASPELLHYCQDGMPEWILRLSIKYPRGGKLKNAHAKCVANIPWITIDRAKKLIAEAKHSVAATADTATQ